MSDVYVLFILSPHCNVWKQHNREIIYAFLRRLHRRTIKTRQMRNPSRQLTRIICFVRFQQMPLITVISNM